MQYIGTWELPKNQRTKFRNYRRVMQRVEKSVKSKYPQINFKRDFPVVPNMSTEKVELANTYFNEGKKIIGPTKKRKYKPKPVGLMGISTIRQRFVKSRRTSSIPAVALTASGSSSSQNVPSQQLTGFRRFLVNQRGVNVDTFNT